MVPKSRIVIFQDNSALTDIACEYLEESEHTIVGKARSLLELRKLLRDKSIKPVDVALIDNQAPYDVGERPEVVGPEAARLIKKVLPEAIQIAWTTTENPGYGEGQYDALKYKGSLAEMGPFVTQLPSRSKEAR